MSAGQHPRHLYNTMKTTKFELMNALFNGHALVIDGARVLDGVLSVELENGGRKSWNVRGYLAGRKTTIFVRTVD